MRFATLAIAASALFAAAAQADVILIDDFNQPAFTRIDDFTVGGVAPVMSSPLIAPNLATSRDVSVDLTVNNSGVGNIFAAVGGGANGRLNISTTTGDNGTAKVTWAIPASPIANPASYSFSIVASALGSIGSSSTPNTVGFVFTGINAANSFSISNLNIGAFGFALPASVVSFGLTPAQAMALSNGGSLVMNLAGGQGWNLTLDQFAITVPEPTSLALVGLALVGAGIASRRRSA